MERDFEQIGKFFCFMWIIVMVALGGWITVEGMIVVGNKISELKHASRSCEN